MALVGCAAALAGAGGPRAMTWTPLVRVLNPSVQQGNRAFYELLRTGLSQDPCDLGLEWGSPERVSSLVVEYATLAHRAYEPDLRAQRLERREEGRWVALPAHLTVDYTGQEALAPLQGRGVVRWTYRFRPVRAEALRVRIDAPAHGDPFYQCIALTAIRAGLDAGAAPAPGVRRVGAPHGPPAWLAPGADLAAPASGARVTTAGGRTTIRWPRPLMVDSVRWAAGAPAGPVVEARVGSAWRPVEALCAEGDGRTWRFAPMATDGLRAAGGPGRPAVLLSEAAGAYFHAAQDARSDLLGERFRAMSPPDLAAMQSLLLPIDFTKCAIGRPADLVETMVTWTGCWFMVDQCGGTDPVSGAALGKQSMERWFAPALGRRPERFGQDWMRLDTRIASGGYPAVVSRYALDGVEATQTVFVSAPGAPAYVNVARIALRNRTRRAVETAFVLAMGRRRMWSDPLSPLTSDPLPTGYRLDPDGMTVRDASGEIIVQAGMRCELGGTGREAHLIAPVRLAPGETRTLDFVAPTVNEAMRDAAALRAAAPAALEQGFRAYWDGVFARAAGIDLPEAPLNDAVRNLIAQCLIITLDGPDVVRYGAYHYEDYFGVEEGWPAVALAQMGIKDTAETILEVMLSPKHMDKANYHHQYRNGLDPWYAITAARLTGDLAWLRKMAPALEAAAEWTLSATAGNRDAKWGGILPRHAYGGDISMPANSFYSNATCWRGLHDTAAAFAMLGDAAKAERYGAAAAAYHRRLIELADALVDRSGPLPFLPMSFNLTAPEGPREKEPPYPALATDAPASDTWRYLGNYWNLFAPLCLEVGLFGTADERARWLPEYMEQRGGILLGNARFSTGYDCIYGKGYIESLLEQGRRGAFQTALYGMFAQGMSRNMWSSPEVSGVFPLRTENRAMWREHDRERWHWYYRWGGGWTGGWQSQEGEPLSAGAGMALQLLRMALVREDLAGDPPTRLLLLDGAPAHWFAPGKRIALREMRTFFGAVSLEVRSARSSVTAVFTPPPGFAAEGVALRIPDGRGRPIRRVTVDGASHAAFAGDTVMLERPRSRVTVVVWR